MAGPSGHHAPPRVKERSAQARQTCVIAAGPAMGAYGLSSGPPSTLIGLETFHSVSPWTPSVPAMSGSDRTTVVGVSVNEPKVVGVASVRIDAKLRTGAA